MFTEIYMLILETWKNMDNYLKYGLENYSLWDKFNPLPTLISFTGEQSCPFVYLLSMSVFLLQPEGYLVVIETGWPSKPIIFIIWPFRRKIIIYNLITQI